jgi:phosphatidylinositol-3-phosphatase
MSYARVLRILAMSVLIAAVGAHSTRAQQVKKVFVVAMENHNWTQPAHQFDGKIQQIFQNPNAPFINSLVNGTAIAVINGSVVNISKQLSYATAYHNVLATPSGNNPSIHPSEPNYLWSEAGTNFGIFNDNDPYASPAGTNQNTNQHLSAFLTAAGRSWRSYQEDIDLTPTAGGLTNVPLPQNQWTVPLSSFSGNFVSGVNAYNGSTQYNYAAKHNPMVFFRDTNGGDNATQTNPLSAHYAPLQQLQTDLANNTVADYNWITPDQYNDMHTALTGGFQGKTGDEANIAQGDNFLSIIVPMIMASSAYQDNGAIIIWWDETESDGPRDNANDFAHTLGEIVISPLARANNGGVPYASSVDFTHSSDLRTWEELFHLQPLLGDAVNANDLSDLFAPGAVTKP